MTASLSPRDRVVVLALMTLNSEATNKALKERFGLELTGESRRRLNHADLVLSTKRGRGFVHELSEEGWAWCAKELAQPAPDRADGTVRVLYAVLDGLHQFLERADRSLYDVYGVDPVESRVRAAYWKLADAPAAWVRLADVRGHLDGVPVDRVDEALVRLERERDVHLVPETDQRQLTEADRVAAVRIGGKDKHLLRVDR